MYNITHIHVDWSKLCMSKLLKKSIFIVVILSLFFFLINQVATALLVAGSTLTFWIRWQTSFVARSN